MTTEHTGIRRGQRKREALDELQFLARALCLVFCIQIFGIAGCDGCACEKSIAASTVAPSSGVENSRLACTQDDHGGPWIGQTIVPRTYHKAYMHIFERRGRNSPCTW